MHKLPALQWYTGDYMKDPAVRSVSYAARGLWTDMLWLMHESVRRGYLQHTNGKPVSNEQLARMTGGSADEVSRLLQELEDSGVFSRTDNGIIYNRRMVRDEHKRAACAEAGRRGGGNPTFKGQTKGGAKGEPKGDTKPASKDISPSPSPSGNTHTNARTREGPTIQKDSPTADNHAVLVFREVYDAEPDIFSKERIETEVENCDVWRQVLAQCRSNGIPATKVGTCLNVYHDKVKNKETGGKSGNGVAEKKAGWR